MTYTISRNNGFYTLTHTDGWMLIISAIELIMSTDGLGDTFSFAGIQLDYNDCTSPTGTSATDLMINIRNLT
jgi:hypothetical protein